MPAGKPTSCSPGDGMYLHVSQVWRKSPYQKAISIPEFGLFSVISLEHLLRTDTRFQLGGSRFFTTVIKFVECTLTLVVMLT